MREKLLQAFLASYFSRQWCGLPCSINGFHLKLTPMSDRVSLRSTRSNDNCYKGLRGCFQSIGRIEFATTQTFVHLRGLIQNQGF